MFTDQLFENEQVYRIIAVSEISSLAGMIPAISPNHSHEYGIEIVKLFLSLEGILLLSNTSFIAR